MKEIKLLQDAVYQDQSGDIQYKAAAIDDERNFYIVKWEITEEFRALLAEGYLVESKGITATLTDRSGCLIDQADACDWSVFNVYDEDGNKIGDQTNVTLVDPVGQTLNSDPAETFAEELLNFRAKYKLSMERMSELSGVPKATICHAENGVSKPTKTTIIRLRHAMENYKKEND